MMHERCGWFPYPANTPKPGDSRHLCVIVQGDFHYIGIASWVHRQGPENPGQWWQNASPVHGFVWAFRPLPEDYPVPPNSAEQLRMCMGAPDPARVDSKAVEDWWNTVRLWNTGREGRYPGGSLG